MKKMFVPLLCLILLSSCSQTKKEQNVNVDSATVSVEIPVPTNEEILRLIKYIPDHGIRENSEKFFTPEYYSLLVEAWDIPSDYPEGIGSEEWLYYFISGNGESYDHIDHITTTVKEGSVFVSFQCVWGWEKDNGMKHQMTLIHNGHHWVIADYDNTKKKLLQYIREQRSYFRSANWKKYLQDSDNMSIREKEEVQSMVDWYFSRHPKDR